MTHLNFLGSWRVADMKDRYTIIKGRVSAATDRTPHCVSLPTAAKLIRFLHQPQKSQELRLATQFRLYLRRQL